MFNHRYFGQSYFGESYFSDGIGAVAPFDARSVASIGSYAPDRDTQGMAGYARGDVGSYAPIITSEGRP